MTANSKCGTRGDGSGSIFDFIQTVNKYFESLIFGHHSAPKFFFNAEIFPNYGIHNIHVSQLRPFLSYGQPQSHAVWIIEILLDIIVRSPTLMMTHLNFVTESRYEIYSGDNNDTQT